MVGRIPVAAILSLGQFLLCLELAGAEPKFDFTELKRTIECQSALMGVKPMLVAGLGNMGYEGTRHNMGQDTVRDLVRLYKATSHSSYEKWIEVELPDEASAIEYVRFSGASSPSRDGSKVTFRVGGEVFLLPEGGEGAGVNLGLVLFVLPYFDINESGHFLSELSQALGIPPRRMIVITDDIQLRRMQVLVSQGIPVAAESPSHPSRDLFGDGHNGLKSINNLMGRANYWRVRLGVSNPRQEHLENKYSLSEWVLGKAPSEERTYLMAPQNRTALEDILRKIGTLESADERSRPNIIGSINGLAKALTVRKAD